MRPVPESRMTTQTLLALADRLDDYAQALNTSLLDGVIAELRTPAPQVEMVGELPEFLAANEAAYAYRPDVYAGVLTNGRDADRYMGWQLAQAALNARAGGDAKDAERWRALRTMTWRVHEIEPSEFDEHGDEAIAAAAAALASQAVGVKGE